jgi:hypothetical protein
LAEPTADDRRLCPTRASGAHSLIAHWITPSTCLERQRRNYHKCFTCQYRGLSASTILPAPAKPSVAEPTPEPAHKRRKRAKTEKASTA